MRPARLALTAVVLLAVSLVGLAAPLLKSHTFRRVDATKREIVFLPAAAQPPKIDGVLDDAAWKTAYKTERFTWANGRPATNKTQLLATFDARNLYLAVRCAVQSKAALKLRFPKDYNGGRAWGDDCVDFKISGDGLRTTCQFILTAAGAYFDARNSVAKWNPGWSRGARIGEKEYTLEIAIPRTVVRIFTKEKGAPFLMSFNRTDRSVKPRALLSFTEPYGDMRTAALFVMGSAKDQTRLSATGTIRRDVDLALYLDRDQYPSFQRLATGRVQVRSGPASPPLDNQAAIELVLSRGKQVVRSQKISPVTSVKLDFDMLLAGLAPGDYVLTARVLDGAKPIAEKSRAFRVRKAAAPAGGRIAVTVPPADGELPRWPLTFGVPFAWGALGSADNVRLVDAEGNELPIQTQVTGRWSKEGSVRWLLVDCIPPARRTAQQFTLLYGPKVRRAAAKGGVRVDESAASVTVSNGRHRYVFPKKRSPGLSEVWRDTNGDGKFEKRLTTQPAEYGPRFVDEQGETFLALRDRDTEVVVEDRGPVKTCVRVSGWHVAKSGDRLGKFIQRYYFYTGLPYVRVYHTFIITASDNRATAGIEKETRYRNIAWVLPWRTIDYYLGTPNILPGRIRGKGGAYLLQRDDRMGRAYKDGKFEDEFEKAEGWVCAGAPGSNVTVAVKDFWQNFPKEIEVERDRLSVHFWPKHAEAPVRTGKNLSIRNVYHQWFAHEGPVLDFKVPAEVLAYIKQDSERYNWNNAKVVNAIGLAKTHEMLLYFHDKDWETAKARTVARVFQSNPTATCDPKYICDTRVFGLMHPHDPKRFPKYERALDEVVDCIYRHRETDRDYGMFNFGDSHHNWFWQGRRWSLHRIWRNTHHGWTRWPWLMYARTGRKDLFDWGDRNARHVVDVDHCHYTPKEFLGLPWPRAKAVGGLCDYKGFVHWASGARMAYNSAADPMLHHYYFTGDRRSLTTALEHGRLLIRTRKAYAHREGSGRATSCAALYFYTWDNDYLDLLDRTVGALFRTQREDGGFPQWENFAPYLQRYIDLTQSRQGMKVMARWGDWIVGTNRIVKLYGSKINILSFAYLYTGDPKYIEAAALRINEAVDNQYLGEDPRYRGMFIHGHSNLDQSYFMQETPYYLQALARYGRAPKEPRPDVSNIRTHWRVKVDGKVWYQFVARLRQTTDAPLALKMNVGNYNNQVFRAELRPIGGGTVYRAEGRTLKHNRRIDLALKAPADGKLEYELRVLSDKNFHTRLPVTHGMKGVKEVYPIFGGGTWTGGRPPIYFNTAPGARRVTLRVTGRAWPLRIRLTDPSGRVVDEATWIGSNSLYTPQHELSAKVDGRRKDWSMRISGYGQVGLEQVRHDPPVKGRTFYFSFAPEKLFDPSP